MDQQTPSMSASPSQSLSSQVSTLRLNIDRRDVEEKEDQGSSASEAIPNGIQIETNIAERSAEDGSNHKSISHDPRERQNQSDSRAHNSYKDDNFTVNLSTNCNFFVDPIDSYTQVNDMRFEDWLEDFFRALDDLQLSTLEDLIFKYNIDVNFVFNSRLNFVQRNYFGWSAAHIVASKGNAKIMKFLLQQGSDINLLTPDGDTALHIAAKIGAADVIQLLLKHDVFLRDRPNNQGITALLKAVFHLQHAFKGSYHRSVDLLLAAGCNPNISSSSLVTALHKAVDKGDHYLVERLINAGANVNALCNQGSSPLHCALVSKHVNMDIVTSLLLAHADTNVRMNGRSLLHIAVSRCDERIVEMFVQFGADTNCRDNSGETPLWVAVEENNIKVVPILLAGGADVKYVKQPQCVSILSQAVLNNSLPMVKLLLDSGASAYTETFMWSTPLHMAVDIQNLDIVKELIRVNCPLNTTSNAKFSLKPMTPIQLAIELGNIEIVFLLLQTGSRVNRMWLRDDRMSPDLANKHDVVLCIEKYLQEVPSLLHLSRLSIRKFLGERFNSAVSQMESHSIIPSKILDYISLKDILN